MKRERLDWLADNPFYTKRFAFSVGRRCRVATIKDVAKELHLDWDTVKALEKQYMREQLRRAGRRGREPSGSTRCRSAKDTRTGLWSATWNGRRPIWFGGKDRSEASMDVFFTWLGPTKCQGVRLAVMDMWKAFRNSTQRNAPQASILFDKFHVMRHLGEALDTVRKREYARLRGKDRRFIKGQKYTLLSRRENLTLDGRRALKELLGGQQTVAHGVPAQRVFWPVVGLPARGMGAALLRELEGGAEVAAAHARTRSSPR